MTISTTDTRIPEQEIRAEAMKLARQWGIGVPYTGVSTTATYAHALIQAAFQAGYDYHRQTCDVTNPRGWTAEEIGETAAAGLPLGDPRRAGGAEGG